MSMLAYQNRCNSGDLDRGAPAAMPFRSHFPPTGHYLQLKGSGLRSGRNGTSLARLTPVLSIDTIGNGLPLPNSGQTKANELIDEQKA
jgi:hypothetical protein